MIFGFTEAQISGFFLTYGVGAFILYMLFIIRQLAWESKAGRFGTFVLFLGLGVCFLGFLSYLVIQWWLERGHAPIAPSSFAAPVVFGRLPCSLHE